MLNDTAKAGFTYLVEVISKTTGQVLDSEVIENIMPIEGINYILSSSVKGATQISSFYLGLYENAYTPQSTDTAATFPTTAGESTAYDSATRPAFVAGAVAGGAVDNSASRAEFTFNATKSIAGGFMVSTNTKGGASGVLLSAVRFASAKAVDDDSILRVTAGLQIVSA